MTLGVCSFCGEQPVAAWFEGPDFRAFVTRAGDVRAEEAWLACASCLQLVEADDADRLAERGMKRLVRRGADQEKAMAFARRAHEQFWSARSGNQPDSGIVD
jgi:hypothetical protein